MSHFNQVANEWDSPQKIESAQLMAQELNSLIELKPTDRVMDFGCGTGLLSFELLPNVNEVVGIDTSEGMLSVMRNKAKGSEKVKTVLLNLEEENYQDSFDLIVTAMAFHHLNTPSTMIKKLQSLLKPKGQLVIFDLAPEDGDFHPDNHAMGVKHFGFSQQEMQQWGAEAGFIKSEYKIFKTIHKNNKNYGQFVCLFS